MAKSQGRLSRRGALTRMGIAFFVVMATYNPTGYSYFHQISGTTWNPVPWGTLILGLLILSAWVLLFKYSHKILGNMGFIMVMALAGLILAMGFSQGWLTTDKPGPLSWFMIIVVAMIFTIGLTGGFLIRSVFGILPTDDDEVGIDAP